MNASGESPDRVRINDRSAQRRVKNSAEVPVSLTLFGASTAGTATMLRYPVGRRVLRALLSLGVCWTLAVAAVFIPLAHFVLVPGFLVLGVILATIRLRQTWALENVRGPCPRCRVEQRFVSAGRSRGQWQAHCPSCLNKITVSPERPRASAPV